MVAKEALLVALVNRNICNYITIATVSKGTRMTNVAITSLKYFHTYLKAPSLNL